MVLETNRDKSVTQVRVATLDAEGLVLHGQA